MRGASRRFAPEMKPLRPKERRALTGGSISPEAEGRSRRRRDQCGVRLAASSQTDNHLYAPGGPSLRDGQAIAASLATIFTLHRSVAERRSPLNHTHLQSSWRMRRERSERSVRTQITLFSPLLPIPTIRQPPTAPLPKGTQRPRCVKRNGRRRRPKSVASILDVL